ncbi:MAG: hypothetical protein K2M84_04855 [Anaeroplasmataceae bacterium]|nr:hypothetical protein [Anaeroplasmataceae bacterium]
MYSQVELKHCLECRWRIKQVKYYCGILGFLFALSMIFALIAFVVNIDKVEQTGTVAGICFLTATIFIVTIFCTLLPFIIYSFNDYKKILRLSQNSSLYKVILDHPNTSFSYRGHVYYTVRFMTEDMKSISSDTKAMWSDFFLAFPMSEYNNKEVEILYNEEYDRVIVLGLKDWQKKIDRK